MQLVLLLFLLNVGLAVKNAIRILDVRKFAEETAFRSLLFALSLNFAAAGFSLASLVLT